MKKFIFPLILLVIIGGAGFWLWTILFPGPEKIIRKELAKLAQEASFKANENPLASVASAQSLAGFFSADAEIVLNVSGFPQHAFSGREEISQAALGARSVARDGLHVEFLDVNVTVGPDKQSANAELTVKAQVSGDKDFNVQEMKLTLQKLDGHWRITHAETVRTLT